MQATFEKSMDTWHSTRNMKQWFNAKELFFEHAPQFIAVVRPHWYIIRVSKLPKEGQTYELDDIEDPYLLHYAVGRPPSAEWAMELIKRCKLHEYKSWQEVPEEIKAHTRGNIRDAIYGSLTTDPPMTTPPNSPRLGETSSNRSPSRSPPRSPRRSPRLRLH